MAEFHEVMKQKNRMCSAHADCNDCPIGKCEEKRNKRLCCDAFISEYPYVAEYFVMQWASANPEPVYPTWIDWWNENFEGDGRRMLTPCSFVSPKELGCSIGHDGCMVAPYKCWHTSIPAEVAQKLGIKPIAEK